jgi:fatty acid desaturase
LELGRRVGFDGVVSNTMTPAMGTAPFAPESPADAAIAHSVRARLQVPTLGIAFAVHVGFAALTWFFHDLPLAFAAPLGAVLLTWHGSFQHETIHGHPTPWRRLNALLASLPLSLWIPYGIYRSTHLQHHRHRGRHLTDASRDPESFYASSARAGARARLSRLLHAANCTLAGRLTLGPALAIGRFWEREARLIVSGNRRRRMLWSRHALAVALLLWWVVGVCRIPFWVYALLIVYPSVSLTLLRSFAEHRADADPRRRTITVEAHRLWALIYLNNNLHLAHHAHPKLPWYQLPRVWRGMREPARELGLVHSRGYWHLIKQYFLRPIIRND